MGVITLARVENGDLPSGRRHSVQYVLENACSTLFSIPSEVVSHTMKVLAMLSLNAKIFSSLSEWDSFLNQEDTLGVYNIQRDFTKWIWFVSSSMKKLAKAVFVRHGGYTRDGFSTELVSILMSTLTCEPPLENFVASIMETYSSSFPSSERLSTSALASLFCPNPASFWFSVSLLSLLLLFYRAEPSAAFLLYVPILEFVCKTDTKAYRRKLQVLMTKVLQSSMCHSVVSLAEQMQRLVECCNQETTSGVEKKKLMVVVPKKVVDVLDRMVGRRVGGKNLSPEEGGETGAHRRAVDLSPEKISYSFAPSSPSSTRGAAPTCIVLDGEEWQEVSFHWLFFMDAEVLSNEVEKKQNAAVEGSQNVTGLSTSLHELFRIAVLQKGVDGSVWESETQTYTTVDDAASAIVTFTESVWRTKGKNELFIPSISTKKKSAARAEEAAIRLTFRRRVLNMLLPILRGREGRANADFFASPERLLATDGWVAQQDIDAYIEGKLQLSSESYSVQDFPQWISEYVAHHDLLGRLEWMEKGRRVRATHAHATSAKDLYQRIIQTKEMLWTFEERAYFSFSRFEKAQEAKEIVTDASNTLSCAVPFSPRPPSRYAWVYCTSPLQKEIRLILRKNMYTAVSVPGVKLLLPATVVAAQQYPKVFSTDEQMDKDFRTPPQAPTSTAPSSAPPADECRDAFQCMKKIKLGRRVQEDAPVEHSEATIRDDGFTDEEEEEEVDCVVQPCVIPQKKGFLEVDLVLLQECYDIYACPSHKVVYGCRRGQKSNGMAQHENIPIWCFTGVYQEWAGEERVDIHLCSSYVSSFPSSLCVASPSSANGTATISILECGRLRDQYLQKCAQKIEKYTKEKEEEEEKNSAARVPNEPAALPNDGDHTAKHEGDNTEACLSVEDKVRNLDEVLRSSIQLLKIRVEKFLMEENETVMELDLPTIVAPFRKQALKEFKLWLVEKKLSYVVKDGDCKAYNSMCTKKTLANQVKLIHNTLILSKESALSDDQLRALYREAELPDTLPMEFLRRALNHTGDNWNNYEEHEFIGDAVLGCVVAVDTFLRHCHDVRRSHAVCGKEESSFRGGPGRSPDVLHSTLHRGTVTLCCENAVLAYLLPRSLNQLLSKLSFKAHADILEALIGVLYDAECGMDVVRRFIQRRFQFLSSLLKEEKGTLVPLSLPVPSSPSETSNTGKRTVLQPPQQRLSEYKKLKAAWELCPYRDDAEGENEECCGALGKSMEATLQVIGVSPSNTPPPPHPSPFSLFGFAYGNLIHVLPSDCCLPSMVEKKGENDMAFGVHDEDNARRKTAHVTDLNPLSCYNSMRGFSRVSFSSHATHFTSGDIFCYRRIYEEEVQHVRSRVIAGAETLAGNGQSCMTFINELFTPFMRFVVDYDSSNILSWNFFRHFLEWTALQEARGGGWRPESESKAGPHEHVHRPSHEAQREGKEEDVVAEKEGRRTETNAVVHPHFRAFAAHPGSPPKVLVASSCSSEKDSYHIHVLHWIIPTAAYARIVQDLEQFIWTKRCRLIVAFRDAVEKCQKVFPVLENMNEGEWWGPSGVEKEEVCGEGTSSQHGSPLENTRHLWLPFLDGPTLIRLQHAFDPPAHAQDGKNEEEDEKTTTKHHHHNKKQGGSTRFGRMVTHFLKSLSPYDAARLLDVPPSHIFLGEVEKTTQRHTYGVYYFFQSAPCDTTTPPPSTTGTARVVVTSRWILGNTILQHWKDFCHAPLPFASSTERYVPPVLPSGASPANLSMWERFWFSYIDPTLKDSQKLRQVYCDKFDMRKGRQYRPFFPYCLASTTPAYAGFAGGREGNGGKMDGFWCDGHGRIDTPSSSSWTPLPNATTKTTTVTIQDGSAGRHPMDALLSSGGTRGAGAEPSKGRPHERQVVFPPHTLYSVKITPSASFCSFSPLSMPICWPSLSIFPQPPRTNPTPQAYYLAQRAREKEIADREREGKNYPKEKVDPTHTMEDDGIIVPMPSLHSLHWSRVRRLQQGCVLVGGMRSPILPRLKTKICAMLQDTRSPSQDGASLERQVEFSCAVVRSPPPPVWAEKDGMRSGDASHVTVPQSDPHQEEETNGCTCMVRWENDDEENDDEEEEEEAPHLWPVALHRRAVWSAHDQIRQDGRPTTTTITTGGGGPSVTIAAMDILHATSLRQPFLRDVQGRLYSSWNVLTSPAGKGNRHWETMESTEWNKGPARYPPSVIASLANGKEEWWDSCAASLLSLCAGPRFCMSNKITKAKTSVASHRLDGSRPSFIASVEKKKEEDQTEHVDDDGDVPSRGIFLEHWRWGESDAMAPPAQWNVAGSADLYGFDWDRCEGEAKEQCAMAAPSLSSGSNMKRARNEEEDENKGKSMLLYPTTTFTTARTTTALAPWTQLSSLLSPPNHFQSWLTNMFVLTRTYQPPLFLTNYLPIKDWMDEKLRAIGNATAKPQCLHPMWLEQDCDTLQWRLIVYREVLFQTSPSLPRSPVPQSLHESHPPSSKETYGSGNVEKEEEGKAEERAAHKLCLMMQRLMQVFTPQIPLPSLREIRTDLTPVLEEAKKAREQHQERKRRALFTEEETKNANAVRTTTHTSSSSSSSSSSASLDDCLSCTTQEMPPSRLQPLRSDRMVGKFIHMICIATGLRRTYFTYPRPSWGCLSSPSTPEASFLDFHSLAIPVSAFPSLTVWFSHVLKAIAADRFLQTNISSPAPSFGTCLVVIGRQEEEDEEEGENNTTEAGSTARVSGTMSFSSPLLWRRLISSLSAVTPFVWQEEELESRIQKLIVHEFTSIYYIFQRNLSRENSCASSSGNAHSLRSSIADLTRLVKHYKCDNRDTCRIVLCPFIPSKE